MTACSTSVYKDISRTHVAGDAAIRTMKKPKQPPILPRRMGRDRLHQTSLLDRTRPCRKPSASSANSAGRLVAADRKRPGSSKPRRQQAEDLLRRDARAPPGAFPTPRTHQGTMLTPEQLARLRSAFMCSTRRGRTIYVSGDLDRAPTRRCWMGECGPPPAHEPTSSNRPLVLTLHTRAGRSSRVRDASGPENNYRCGIEFNDPPPLTYAHRDAVDQICRRRRAVVGDNETAHRKAPKPRLQVQQSQH